MKEKKGQLSKKGFCWFHESDRIENFICLKDGFWFKIFHNLLGVCLNLFVTSGYYWNSTCNKKLVFSEDSRKQLFKVVC